MAESELLKKLKYKGGRILLVHAPEGYSLGEEDAGEAAGPYPFIQVFVTSAENVRAEIPHLLTLLDVDGVFWLTYPKQSSGIKTDINRDILANMIQDETEFRVVSNVSIDATWSALRLRQKDKVKSRA